MAQIPWWLIWRKNRLLPADTSCIDTSSVPRSCDDEGSPPGRRPWRSSANDKLITLHRVLRTWESLGLPWMHWWAGARPTSPSPRRPRGRRPGSAGARAARPSWRTPASERPRAGSRGRTWAGPGPGALPRPLRMTDISGRQSTVSFVRRRGIYIKLPWLYTITWSREGYLFCQCQNNVNWRALIKNKSSDKLYNIQETIWDAVHERERIRERWDRLRHSRQD